jgi:hypothetical protein
MFAILKCCILEPTSESGGANAFKKTALSCVIKIVAGNAIATIGVSIFNSFCYFTQNFPDSVISKRRNPVVFASQASRLGSQPWRERKKVDCYP